MADTIPDTNEVKVTVIAAALKMSSMRANSFEQWLDSFKKSYKAIMEAMQEGVTIKDSQK
jgi:hypothetical protein